MLISEIKAWEENETLTQLMDMLGLSDMMKSVDEAIESVTTTVEEIQKAQEQEGTRFVTTQNLESVMCPECGHEFFIEKQKEKLRENSEKTARKQRHTGNSGKDR